MVGVNLQTSKLTLFIRCQYSHDLRWTRRPPWKYPYSPELCPNVRFLKDSRGRVVVRSNCWSQRKCKFSHTLEEQIYHPKIYKTVLCDQFQADGWCERYYCPFAHYENEVRPIDPNFQPNYIMFGNSQKDACPDIYLPSDKPHPKLRSHFLTIMEGRKKLRENTNGINTPIDTEVKIQNKKSSEEPYLLKKERQDLFFQDVQKANDLNSGMLDIRSNCNSINNEIKLYDYSKQLSNNLQVQRDNNTSYEQIVSSQRRYSNDKFDVQVAQDESTLLIGSKYE